MPAHRTRDTSLQSRQTNEDIPSLQIISPTPRAFTFNNSPYSSPSTSPFEHNRSHSPSTSVSSFAPSSPPTIQPSQPISLHKRRKSSVSEILPPTTAHRPKKGDEDYIKRPENAFILFRRKCCEDRQLAQDSAAIALSAISALDSDSPAAKEKKQRQADLSKTISQQWKGLPAEERAYWEDLAKEKKKEHEAMYPNYVYRPQRAKDKDGKVKKNVTRRTSTSRTRNSSRPRNDSFDTSSADSAGPDSVSFVLPYPSPLTRLSHGRSSSMPAPPLGFQSVHVPHVYHGGRAPRVRGTSQQRPRAPSNLVPGSPSLLPMLARRSSHPERPKDPFSSFDYLPNETLMPPPAFGASFQPEFFTGMFQVPEQPDDPSQPPTINTNQSYPPPSLHNRSHSLSHSVPLSPLQYIASSISQNQSLSASPSLTGSPLLHPTQPSPLSRVHRPTRTVNGHNISPSSSISSESSSGPSSPHPGPYTPQQGGVMLPPAYDLPEWYQPQNTQAQHQEQQQQQQQQQQYENQGYNQDYQYPAIPEESSCSPDSEHHQQEQEFTDFVGIGGGANTNFTWDEGIDALENARDGVDASLPTEGAGAGHDGMWGSNGEINFDAMGSFDGYNSFGSAYNGMSSMMSLAGFSSMMGGFNAMGSIGENMGEDMLLGDDFDLGNIPRVEMGLDNTHSSSNSGSNSNSATHSPSLQQQPSPFAAISSKLGLGLSPLDVLSQHHARSQGPTSAVSSHSQPRSYEHREEHDADFAPSPEESLEGLFGGFDGLGHGHRY